MRTTLNIDDDVLVAARSLADARGMSIGEAVSYLARRGATARTKLRIRNGFPVFDLEQPLPAFGPEDLQAALDAEDRERASDFWKPQR